MIYAVLKYIVTADEQVVLFPQTISHDALRHLQPVSAGFVTVRPPVVRVGPLGSDRLGLKPAAKDEQLIKEFLGV